VQTLDSFVLSPYILGRSSGLHPVTTLAVLLIGGQVAGLLGMLLAIPVASTLKTLAAEFVLPEIRRLAGRPADDAAPQPHTPR
jgi:predicted PurR-regulated permease PerM